MSALKTALALILVPTGVLSLMTACENTPSQSTYSNSDHHTKDGFKNPYSEPFNKGALTFFRMKYFGDEAFSDQEKEAHKVPVATPDIPRLHAPATEEIQVSWLGQSSFLLQHNGINIMTDPVLSLRASPVQFAGPKRLVDMPIGIQDLPPIDYVVISHNHYDHLDRDTVITLSQQSGGSPLFVVPLGLKQWFLNEGIVAESVLELDWWFSAARTKASGAAVKFTATPAQHWSGRGLLDRHQSLWASWHIDLGDFRIWFAGDTGYNDVQFKQIGKHFNHIDLALIPIGAYAPRWFMKMQHVNTEEAVQIHKDIGAKNSIGMHWGTFQLTAEPIDEPVLRLQQAVQQDRIRADEFVTLAIGETRIYTGAASP